MGSTGPAASLVNLAIVNRGCGSRERVTPEPVRTLGTVRQRTGKHSRGRREKCTTRSASSGLSRAEARVVIGVFDAAGEARHVQACATVQHHGHFLGACRSQARFVTTRVRTVWISAGMQGQATAFDADARREVPL